MRFNVAAHHGAISYFDPGVSLKLIRLARDAIEELARDVAAAKHEVRGQALRETHKGERGVTHHRLDRPLNPAQSLRCHLLVTARCPGSGLLIQAVSFCTGRKLSAMRKKVSMHPASMARPMSAGGRTARLSPCQARLHVEDHPLDRTKQGIKREQRVGQIEPPPDPRTEQRAHDEIQAIAPRSVQAELI